MTVIYVEPNVINDFNSIESLPIGTEVVDADGDTGIKLNATEWSVTGFYERQTSSFFTLPVTVTSDIGSEPEVQTLRDLDTLPDGTLIVGLDPQRTLRFKQGGTWVDPHKPIGTTWGLNTYVLARRYGVRVVAQPNV
ncbi:hypothetical protein BI024_gp59 [Streptomyces phage Nanodon]|uniref:Uncharacterized protein n=1 Tax=Streptomyces phage Nanodon TaxID=1873777 RepID=A0A1B1PA79_9CAUD|nr:hypothetical protein BI024_gp59 [Streptomyces phage Nanodon]ANT41063.1 hypothetical protein SEA_NANODON_59 [Streptomyces phage Nanodon]